MYVYIGSHPAPAAPQAPAAVRAPTTTCKSILEILQETSPGLLTEKFAELRREITNARDVPAKSAAVARLRDTACAVFNARITALLECTSLSEVHDIELTRHLEDFTRFIGSTSRDGDFGVVDLGSPGGFMDNWGGVISAVPGRREIQSNRQGVSLRLRPYLFSYAYAYIHHIHTYIEACKQSNRAAYIPPFSIIIYMGAECNGKRWIVCAW